MRTKIAEKLEKKSKKQWLKWIDGCLDVFVFEKRNPFTDEDIRSWSLEEAKNIIWILTPADDEWDESAKITINRIKDLHGIL